MVGEGQFGLGVETHVLAGVLLVEVLLELVVLELGLLVPVAELGFGGETVLDGVVVHG